MVEAERNDKSAASRELGHEPADESLFWVLTFAVALILLSLIIGVVLWWMLQRLLAREPAVKPPASVLAATQRGQLPPEPRLEGLDSYGGPSQPAEAGRSAEQGYAWVDQKAGIVRIPVEEAMAILADKLPSRRPEEGSTGEEAEPVRPSASNSGRTLPGGQR